MSGVRQSVFLAVPVLTQYSGEGCPGGLILTCLVNKIKKCIRITSILAGISLSNELYFLVKAQQNKTGKIALA